MKIFAYTLLLIVSLSANAMGINCISTTNPNSYAFIIHNQWLVTNGKAYKLVSRFGFTDNYITEFYLNDAGKYNYGVITHGEHDHATGFHPMVFNQYSAGYNNLIKTENFNCRRELFHTPDY